MKSRWSKKMMSRWTQSIISKSRWTDSTPCSYFVFLRDLQFLFRKYWHFFAWPKKPQIMICWKASLQSVELERKKMKEKPQRSWNARKSHDFQVSFLMAVQQLLLVNGSLQSARTPRDFVGRTTLKLDDSYDIHSFSPIQLFSGGKTWNYSWSSFL